MSPIPNTNNHNFAATNSPTDSATATTSKHWQGLTDAEVLASREEHGSNLLTPPPRTPLWRQYLVKFRDPLIIILLIAGVMSVGIACYERFSLGAGPTVFFEPIGIFIAILLATGLAFIFESQADREFSILNKVGDDEHVQVIREGHHRSVRRQDIVVGDIIVLTTGQEIPADAELLDSVSLSVDESTLNGESVPARKSPHPADDDPEASYPTRHVMRGTKVMEGHGLARVYAVGDNTENGRVYRAAQIDNSVKTPLNEQLDRLGMLITHLSYAIAGAVIIVKLLVYFAWAPAAWLIPLPVATFFWLVIERFPRWRRSVCFAAIAAFFAILIGMILLVHEIVMPTSDVTELLAYALGTVMIAVTLIVVAVPEGLPMAVTLSLAYSMRRMLKTNNLVRRMHACETMGATTVICTDKTGTLTQNRMRVQSMQFCVSSDLLAEGIAVNSTAELDLRHSDQPEVLGNPTEGALLLWLHEQGRDYSTLRQEAQRLAEVPFSTERKYMATLITSPLDGRRRLHVKGAPEIVCAMCSTLPEGVTRQDLQDALIEHQQRAMRTLALAAVDVPEGVPAERFIEIFSSAPATGTPFLAANTDEAKEPISQDNTLNNSSQQGFIEGLHLLGIVAISDPVRPDVPDAVDACTNAGIQIKIVTGDTPATACEIARQIGLWKESDTDNSIITGPEFAELDDATLAQRLPQLKIIARARPMDKKRLVESLQRQNEVVAVTGDGTNDAPALKAAHVGLSMGDGTSVAKEASDITIIDNSFASIGRAVMWGRSLYQNIQRFLLFQLTVNVAACCLVLAGSFMGTESPLTVTQMLWVNLIMDTFGAMALSSLPPTPDVMHQAPRRRGESSMTLRQHIQGGTFILDRALITNILGVGGFFFAILMVFLYIFQHADITCMGDLLHLQMGPHNAVTPYELTLLFSIFVWTHLWYMFDARGFMTGRSGFNLHGCTGFWTITTVIVVGQILIVGFDIEWAGISHLNLAPFFDVVPMRMDDWLIIVLTSSLVTWVREAKIMLKL